MVEFYKNIFLQEIITHIDTVFCGSNYCCLGDLSVHTNRKIDGKTDKQTDKQTKMATLTRILMVLRNIYKVKGSATPPSSCYIHFQLTKSYKTRRMHSDLQLNLQQLFLSLSKLTAVASQWAWPRQSPWYRYCVPLSWYRRAPAHSHIHFWATPRAAHTCPWQCAHGARPRCTTSQRDADWRSCSPTSCCAAQSWSAAEQKKLQLKQFPFYSPSIPPT